MLPPPHYSPAVRGLLKRLIALQEDLKMLSEAANGEFTGKPCSPKEVTDLPLGALGCAIEDILHHFNRGMSQFVGWKAVMVTPEKCLELQLFDKLITK